MEIKSISQKIFRTSSDRTENNSNHTNPFGVSFKGNIINADVFEEKNSDEKQNRGKLFVSAMVGSINSISSAVSRGRNAVISFGMKIKETTTDLWDKTNINMKELASRMPAFTGAYSVRNLQERDISELKAMFEERLPVMEEA